MPSLILLRGLPGSGKTTLAKELAENGKYPSFSVDDYFTDSKSKVYKFEFDKNHLAYKKCEESVLESMRNNAPKILVHNCFTMEWEMEPYFKLASEHTYTIYVITVENRHHGHNRHEITDEQIKKMALKYKVVLH